MTDPTSREQTQADETGDGPHEGVRRTGPASGYRRCHAIGPSPLYNLTIDDTSLASLPSRLRFASGLGNARNFDQGQFQLSRAQSSTLRIRD